MALDTITLTNRLAAAETAYHNLMIGVSARVIIDSNSERVEFTAANAGKLQSYIQELKRQLGLVSTGPMRVYM